MNAEHLRERLLREATALLEKVGTLGTAVGSYEVVEFEPEYSLRNNIGRFGRMSLKDEGAQYYAAPKSIDREPWYEFDNRNCIGAMTAWLEGRAPDWSHLDNPSRNPVPLVSVTDYDGGTYEERMISFFQGEGDVTLVNPSFKTLSAAKRASTDKIYVWVPEADAEWYDEVVDFVSKSAGKLEQVGEVRGTAYLGESMPKVYPEKWWRVIPSPYSRKRPASVRQEEGGLSFLRVVTKQGEERMLYNYLSKTPAYVYSPEQVDSALSMEELRFFIETNVKLKMPQVKASQIFHKPLYIVKQGKSQRVEYNGLQYKVIGTEVINIVSTETYLSKRATLPLPPGYTWAPIVEHGTHLFTYAMSSPRPLANSSIQRDVQVMGTAVLSPMSLVEIEDGWSVVEADGGLAKARLNADWCRDLDALKKDKSYEKRKKEIDDNYKYELSLLDNGDKFTLFETDLMLVQSRRGEKRVWLDREGRVFLRGQVSLTGFGLVLADGVYRELPVERAVNRYGVFINHVRGMEVAFSSVSDFLYNYRLYQPPPDFSTFVPQAIAEGGTVSRSGRENDLILHTTFPVSTWDARGITSRELAKKMDVSVHEATKMLCSFGMVLWRYGNAVTMEFVRASCVQAECSGTLMVKRPEVVTVSFETFAELMGLLNKGMMVMELPLDRPPGRLLEILRANGFFVTVVPSIKSRCYRVRWMN